MISVLVTNPKGGCGKTTIATHLAAAFANGGLKTALAETDRQRSSLGWLAERPKSAAPITGLNWIRRVKDPPKGTARLVIDSSGSLRIKQVRDLIRSADIIVVPVLPSAFDVRSTGNFLAKLAELKPIRKNRKPFALVRNRVRLGSRAAKRLDVFLLESKAAQCGWLTDRAIYNEMAWLGLSIFDLHTHQAMALQRDWIPLIRYIENEGELSTGDWLSSPVMDSGPQAVEI